MTVLSVHLRCARDQDRTLVAVGSSDHHFGAAEVGGERPEWLLDDQTDTNCSSQMHDCITLVHELVYDKLISNRAGHHEQPGMMGHPRQVSH